MDESDRSLEPGPERPRVTPEPETAPPPVPLAEKTGPAKRPLASLSPAPPAVAGPSFLAIFRTIVFVVAAGGLLFVAGRRWFFSFSRYRMFSTSDVSSLLAADAVQSPSGEFRDGESKKPRDVVFRLEAPGAKSVLLGGSFNGFDARETALTRGEDGTWETTLSLLPGRYLYKFKVDGKWMLDPSNPNNTSPPRQASVLEIQ